MEGCISVSVDELSDLKKTFEDITELLKHVMDNEELQLIPVGSFVIGCVRKNNYTLDAYLHIDTKENKLTCEELTRIYEEKRLQVTDPTQEPQCNFSKFIYEIEKDPLNQEDYVMFKHISNVNKVKVFIMSLGGNNNNTRTMNHYTAGIYHSNWLVTNLQGQNNPSTIRLFRLVREWKSLKGFYFLPSEVLDLTLSYATFSFKETGVFKV